MTDIMHSPLDVSVEMLAVVFPIKIDAVLDIETVTPIPLVAQGWDGFELGNVRLDRLSYDEGISNNIGIIHPDFQRKYESNVDETEKSLNATAATIEVLQRALEDVAAAVAKAEQAQQDADTVKREQVLFNSYTEPTQIVTADGSGSVTIDGHNRIYGDGSSVAVTGATLDGFTSGDTVTPFYDDPDYEGGAVVWQAAVNEVVAQANGRHTIGGVPIPAAGSPPSSGSPSYPPNFDPPPNDGNPIA